jgi:hypothetical protein
MTWNVRLEEVLLLPKKQNGNHFKITEMFRRKLEFAEILWEYLFIFYRLEMKKKEKTWEVINITNYILYLQNYYLRKVHSFLLKSLSLSLFPCKRRKEANEGTREAIKQFREFASLIYIPCISVPFSFIVKARRLFSLQHFLILIFV